LENKVTPSIDHSNPDKRL